MKTELKKSFEALNSTMDRHMATLTTNPSPIELDTRTMLFESKRAFENLRCTLSSLPVTVRKQFKEEVKAILEKSEQLALILAKRKETLSVQLLKNANGKKALKGYHVGSRPAYRFMNTAG